MSNQSLQLLIVDDDDTVRDTLSAILSLSGYAVQTAADGAEALSVLRTRQVDLVITDLMMPGISGIELAEQVARVHPQLPFIVLSAFGTAEYARESLQHGAVDFITKPVGRRELIIAVERNLERCRLARKQLHEATAEILFSTVQALAAAIDLKDPYTAGHSQRVARIADRLAPLLGLSEEDRYLLRLAAAMHDIGKIGVRDLVLRKPGRLNAEEWAEMRRHPCLGSELLDNIKELHPVASLIRHHHENVDGSGYPDGLQGEAIPPLARVLAVADAYEALTSDRSYRKAMPQSKAFEVLREEAGRRYEPELVQALIAAVEQPSPQASDPDV